MPASRFCSAHQCYDSEYGIGRLQKDNQSAAPSDGVRPSEYHLHNFLRSTGTIDYVDAAVRTLAAELGRDAPPMLVAERCFHWVRDNIRHSIDHGDSRTTCSASDVLRHGTGLCYAKSHLLAALIRANGIPCGLVYQRLATDDLGTSFCLHGLNAVWLVEHVWYRVDARGNRDGVATSFDPPSERLAFAASLQGEGLFNEIFADPLPVVLSALSQHGTVSELSRNLPDWTAEESVGQGAADNMVSTASDDTSLFIPTKSKASFGANAIMNPSK
jgi:hypothetical protein